MQSKDSITYWTCCFLIGLYTLIYSLDMYIYVIVSVMALVLILLFFKSFKRFINYLFFGMLFFILGGMVMEKSVFNEIKLPKGDLTFIGDCMAVKTGDEWSQIKIKLTGYYDINDDEWTDLKNGDKILLVANNVCVPTLETGDKIVFSTALKTIDNKNNPGEFNAKSYYLSQGILYSGFLSTDTLYKVEGEMAKGFYYYLNQISKWADVQLDTYIGGEEGAVVKGMLLGDQSSIDWEIKQAFINTGSSHMLAVSGAHIAVITAVLIWLIGKLGINSRGVWASLFLLLFLWIYAFLTGASASVLRSVIMFSLFIFVRFAYRPANNVQILCISALLIIAVDWHSALDIGFQLSYSAMLGIFIVYPKLLHLWEPKKKVCKWLWEGTVLCIAAQVFTTPLALFHFHQFPNYFILSNFLVMLAATPMLVGGMLLLAVSKVKVLGSVVGAFLKIFTYAFIESLKMVDNIPFSVAFGYDLTVFTFAVAVLLTILFLFRKSMLTKVFCMVGFFVVISFQRWENYRKDGIYFFNNQGFSFVFKKGEKAVVFTSDFGSSIKTTERMMKDFVKIYPCDFNVQILPKYNEIIDFGREGQLKRNTGYYTLLFENKEYYLVYNASDYFTDSTVNRANTVITFESVKTIPKSLSVTDKGFWLE